MSFFKHRRLFWAIGSLLLAGSIINFLFTRNLRTLALYQLFAGVFDSNETAAKACSYLQQWYNQLFHHEFIQKHLTDTLWLSAFIFFTLPYTDHSSLHGWSYFFILLGLGMISEFFQLIIPATGSFDVWDGIIYGILAAAAGIISRTVQPSSFND